MKYQCYYNETIFIENNDGYPVPVIGKKVVIPEALFDTEAEAEHYCCSNVGSQQCGNEWIENDINYEEVKG